MIAVDELDTVNCLVLMGELATMDEGVKFVLGDGGSTVEVLITVIVVIRLDTVDCPMLMGELKVMDEDASSALED